MGYRVTMETGDGVVTEASRVDVACFEDALTPDEYGRLEKLAAHSTRLTVDALSTAYIAGAEGAADLAVFAAWVRQRAETETTSGAELDIPQRAITRVARQMPKYLAAHLPAVVWNQAVHDRALTGDMYEVVPGVSAEAPLAAEAADPDHSTGSAERSPLEQARQAAAEEEPGEFSPSIGMERLLHELSEDIADGRMPLRESDRDAVVAALFEIVGEMGSLANVERLTAHAGNLYVGMTGHESAEQLEVSAATMAVSWNRFRQKCLSVARLHSGAYARNILHKHLDPADARIHGQAAGGEASYPSTPLPMVTRDATGSGSLESLDDLVDVLEEQWQDKALCAQTDPEAFFPEKGGSTREAKRICQGCEVRSECLGHALDNDERFGIWGGLSERERRRIKRGMYSVSEAISEADGKLEARLIAKREMAKRIEQLFSILCVEAERDDEFEEEVSYDDDLRERLIDTVLNKLYRRGVENPDETRLQNLQRYFTTQAFTGEDAQWYIDNETRLAKDLRGFEMVLQGIHEQYAAMQREAAIDEQTGILQLCRDMLEAEAERPLAG